MRMPVKNLIALWLSLDLRRRVAVVGASLAVFVAVLAMSRLAGAPNNVLLYAGLDAAAAGEVIAALDQQGVPYEVRGAAIYVDEARRDSLRMALAGQGLPANSGAGYEILEGLTGFGTTSQMFDAAYWRAKEGEIARTVLANPLIRAARVHVAQAPTRPFQRDARATASVTVTTLAGGLPADQARALRHLVAAAVPGMTPADVAVIDTVAGLLPGEEGDSRPDAAADARAAELRGNVERLLAARVGPGKAVVEVAVDVVTERESISERRIDPQGRVAVSTESETRSGSSSEPGGDVTVASNLPEGDAAAGAAGRSENRESRERTNYELSETSREVLRNPGAVRRISVAVLVDGVTVTGADGSVTQEPRPEAELAVLKDLVASAVGLDEARGDVVTIRSLAFQPQPEAGTLAEAGMMSALSGLDAMALIQTAVLALVVLVLGLFVIRPVLAGSRSAAGLPAPAQTLALPAAEGGQGPVLTGEIDDLPGPAFAADDAAAPEADPVARLRRLIEERQAESIEILRGWMEQEEERA